MRRPTLRHFLLRRVLPIVVVAGIALLLGAYLQATAEPADRQSIIALLPPDSADRDLRIVLLADIHVAGPDMPPERLDRIVAHVNAMAPDLVLIAGDLVSDKRLSTRRYALDEAVAPLRDLKPRLGNVAVLGNHDHWRNAAAARRALHGAGVIVLQNDAVRAGPLAIGGLDDAFTGHDDLPRTLAAMDRVGGIPLLLSHSPDPFPQFPARVPLMLAGHTHCGQIRLPLVGAVSYMSAYGERYACGEVREAGRTLIVSGGLGTSIMPLRLGTQPQIWEVTLVRKAAPSRELIP